MKARNRRYRSAHEPQSYWESFVDIMTSTALVFFFILILALGYLTVFVEDVAQERASLYVTVEQSLQQQKANPEVIDFDKNEGRIIIKTESFFDLGQYTLKEDGIKTANMLNGVFLNLLKDKNIENAVQYIEVVGHTDFIGNTIDNRELSTERAVSFLNAMMPIESELENSYGAKFKASGMSEFETNNTKTLRDRGQDQYNEEATKKDRKIEVRIVFKDDNINNAIKERIKEGIN